jgi:hypothetical protein
MVEHMRKEQKIFCLSVSIITIILVGLIYYLLVPTSKATFSNEITNNVKLNKTNNTSTVQNTSQIKSIEIITSVIKENGTTKVITKQVQSTSENNTSITKNQTVTSATSKTIYEENQELIKKISDYYGYKVGYNDESYYYGGSEATLLTDETLANTTLKDIIRKSSQFPTGFFRKLKIPHGFRIELYENIPGAAGVTSYEFGDNYMLALDVRNGMPYRTFYHELWHVMEKYIEYYNGQNIFDSWNNLNPTNFVYGNDNNPDYTILDCTYQYEKLVCNKDIKDISFVSLYAKSSAKEDRAELFADLMFRPYKKEYMNYGYGINNKAIALSKIINNYFGYNTGPWDHFISF